MQWKPVSEPSPAVLAADRFRHNVLLVVIVAGLFATVIGWYVMGLHGPLSTSLSAVQAVTTATLLVLLVIAWRRWLPQRLLEICCLLYLIGVCLACMALRLYSAHYGAGIHLETLYLWIPLVYVFAFMLTNHKQGLVLSLVVFGLFVGVSAPYLVGNLGGSYANLTVQLHLISGVMIVALYFFSGYQHRLRLAEVDVDRFARLSSTDELTQLPNRRHMAAVIEAELRRFAQQGTGFALLLFDIDRFKTINDRFGHSRGDQALVTLAAQAAELFRGVATLGRWGGDEFVALAHAVGAGDAVRMADALCAHIASEPLPGGEGMTLSCGVTLVRAGDNIDSLLQRADAALYAAKRGGRNRVESVLDGRHDHASA